MSLLVHLNDLPPVITFCPSTERSFWDKIKFGGCGEIRCEPCDSDAKHCLTCKPRYIRHCDEPDPVSDELEPISAETKGAISKGAILLTAPNNLEVETLAAPGDPPAWVDPPQAAGGYREGPFLEEGEMGKVEIAP